MFGAGPGPRQIDLGNPVNWAHPLNRGLLAWWLPLPNNRGGSRLFDLGGRYPGTLTGGTTWAPGGFGATRHDGTDDHVDVGTGFNSLTRWTVGGWGKTSTAGNKSIIGCGGGGADSRTFSVGQNGSGNARTYFTTGAGSGYVGIDSSTPVADGKWHHIIAALSDSGYVLYVDGVSVGTTGSGTPITGVGSCSIGRTNDTQAEYWTGDISGVVVYNRGLSASEVWALYDQSRRDHPDTLRHFVPAAWSFGFSAAGGGGGNRRRRVLCGGR